MTSFFAAGDEQHITFIRELLKAEDIIVRFASRMQESHGADWAIHLDKCSHCVAEHCLFHCGAEGVGLPLIRDGFKTRKRLHPEALQGLCVDTVTSPKGNSSILYGCSTRLNCPLFLGAFSPLDDRGRAGDFVTGAMLRAFPGSEMLSCRSRMMVSKTCINSVCASSPCMVAANQKQSPE